MISEAIARLTRAVTSLQKRRQKDTLARKHQRNLTAFFQKQKGMVLDQLRQRQYLFTESYRQLSEEITRLTLQNWQNLWDEIAHNSTAELQHIIASASADGLASGAVQLKTAMAFDAKTTFSLANPRAVRWFQQNGGSVDKIRGIQATTGDSLRRVIESALDEGWSYSSTAKEIQKLYDGPISRARAQRIAVFETGSAYEQGNKLFAESLVDDGVEMQERWVTSHDEKVRPEHTANENEGWVEIGHVYSSGNADVPTDPGCRCYKEYREAPK
jgi:hypothetical protein